MGVVCVNSDRFTVRAAALLLTTGVLFAGCGSSGDGTAGQTVRQANVRAALPRDVPSKVSVGVQQPVKSFDPDRAVEEVDVMALALVGGRLLRAAGDGVEPWLAKRCDFTRGYVVYRCTLRPDAKFSDGSPLTSRDVLATYERAIRDPGNVNAGLFKGISDISAPDAETVVFRLRDSMASFPLALTEGPYAIFPADRIDEPGFFQQPVTSGAYAPAGPAGRTVAFARNEHLPRAAQPLVETVEFRFVEDPNTRLQQLTTGQLDVAHQLPPRIAARVSASSVAYATPQYGGIYIYMNGRRGPLADPRVRKAISLAVDREQLNELAFLGRGRPLGSFLPSVMEGHDAAAPTARDLDAARALLAGSPCADGCQIPLMVRVGAAPYDTLATVVKQNLSEIGIEVQLQNVDTATAGEKEQSGDFAMEIGNLYDVVDAPELIMLPYGLTQEAGIDALFSGYDSPRMSRLVSGLASDERDERATTLREINELFAADLPFVPLLDLATPWASRVSPRVIAFTPSGTYQVGTADHGPGE